MSFINHHITTASLPPPTYGRTSTPQNNVQNPTLPSQVPTWQPWSCHSAPDLYSAISLYSSRCLQPLPSSHWLLHAWKTWHLPKQESYTNENHHWAFMIGSPLLPSPFISTHTYSVLYTFQTYLTVLYIALLPTYPTIPYIARAGQGRVALLGTADVSSFFSMAWHGMAFSTGTTGKRSAKWLARTARLSCLVVCS